MALQDNVKKLRDDTLAQGKEPVPAAYQGVTKDRIAAVLREIDRYTTDQRDAVFALLDDVDNKKKAKKRVSSNIPTTVLECADGTTPTNGILRRALSCHLSRRPT